MAEEYRCEIRRETSHWVNGRAGGRLSISMGQVLLFNSDHVGIKPDGCCEARFDGFDDFNPENKNNECPDVLMYFLFFLFPFWLWLFLLVHIFYLSSSNRLLIYSPF